MKKCNCNFSVKIKVPNFKIKSSEIDEFYLFFFYFLNPLIRIHDLWSQSKKGAFKQTPECRTVQQMQQIWCSMFSTVRPAAVNELSIKVFIHQRTDLSTDLYYFIQIPYRLFESSRMFIMSPPLTYLQKWRQVL